MSREIPILFSKAMVQANRAGRKSETRRIAEFVPRVEGADLQASSMQVKEYSTGHPDLGFVIASRDGNGSWNDRTYPLIPRWKKGDVLWVRETWCPTVHGSYEPFPRKQPAPTSAPEAFIQYAADYKEPLDEYVGFWRPSIHMPRWACRDTYLVTDVRVERLQDITEEDALAEGIECFTGRDGVAIFRNSLESRWFATAVEAYRDLWDAINGKKAEYAWAANPWVNVLKYDNPACKAVSA